jgi:hypothetical protein
MARSELIAVRVCAGGFGLLAMLASIGCQSDYGGQTLPSPYWLKDDIQYFPAGPEFKLSREAAALKTYGTGRAAKPAGGPLGPAGEAPRPSNILDGAVAPPAPEAPAAGPAAAQPEPAAAMPADEGAAPPADGQPERDPFEP